MVDTPGRLLLLIPTTTYRADAFTEAARRLGVAVDMAVTIATEEPSTLERPGAADFLTLDFRHPDRAVRDAVAFARDHPVRGVVGVDDQTTVAAAAVAEALGLAHNPVEAALAARDKFRMRDAFRAGGVRVPDFQLVPLEADPSAVAREVSYPCVLKPRGLAASQGVIRADAAEQFVAAFRRVAAVIRRTASQLPEGLAAHILVEDFIPGREVALEGLLADGELMTLAVFDKPDPLDGPVFEETIYVTPSRLPADGLRELTAVTAEAARALGLRQGPIHAEVRLNEDGPWVIEVAARSIGGLCSHTLRFGAGMSLEELIIRQALGLEIASFERERAPAGVMMVPTPRAGVLRGIRGVDAARAVAGVEDVAISAHLGQNLIPLPEGAHYLGFIFARAATPAAVEAALRAAHRLLDFEIEPA